MTTDRRADVSKAQDLLLQMKGELVWLVHLSADNVLRMNFGNPNLKVREPNPHDPQYSQAVIDALERRIVTPIGRWHLFISNSDWNVNTKFYACSRSDTNVEKINVTLRQLDGQRLIDVSEADGRGSYKLDFDLGGSLHISASAPLEIDPYNEDAEWTLFFDDGNYINYTKAGNLTQKDGGKL